MINTALRSAVFHTLTPRSGDGQGSGSATRDRSGRRHLTPAETRGSVRAAVTHTRVRHDVTRGQVARERRADGVGVDGRLQVTSAALPGTRSTRTPARSL